MQRAAVFALTLAVLFVGFAPQSFGQGRPRRVDPSQTVPAPGPETQDPGTTAPTAEPDEPVKLEGALIEVPIVAADRSGHYVPQLKKTDFRVLEDGVEQDVTFFSSERVPIHVAIVMDTSGSTRDTIYDIQEAAIEFISQLEPGDNVMIVSFSNQVIVEQEFTNDRGLLASAIRRTQANGSTKLYEAVYLTVSERLRQVDGRKAMIILSDGEDTASHDVSFEEAVNVCSESDVVAYGIRYPESAGTNVFTIPNTTPNTFPGNGSPYPNQYPQPRQRKPRQTWPNTGQTNIPWPKWPFTSNLTDPQFGGRNPGPMGQGTMGRSRFMETVTSNTGGTLFYADQVDNVRSLLAIIAEELRHVYVVGYSPSNSLHNGGYRRITVQVPSRPDLAIRHRLGYQAEAYK
ncbi:MAG TPA: VWA domain-containing protein [Blastocatellia bacterium]|nr:VWA domain-containing protein [Blastocatellia bacterium]